MKYKKLNALKIFSLYHKYDKAPRKLKKRFKNTNAWELFNFTLKQIEQKIGIKVAIVM